MWASQVTQWSIICLQCRRHGFDPWVRKIPWNWKWRPTPVFLPGKSHRQRSLAVYSPWGHKELDTTEHCKSLHHRCSMELCQNWGCRHEGKSTMVAGSQAVAGIVRNRHPEPVIHWRKLGKHCKTSHSHLRKSIHLPADVQAL